MKKIGAAVVAAACGVVVVLSGCSNPADKLADKAGEAAAENILENAAEDGAGGDVDVDIDAGGGASLPDTWPDELPVPDANLSFVTSSEEEKSYYLLYDGADEAAATGVVDDLKDAGFTVTTEMASDGTTIVGLENGTWSVGYTYSADSEGVYTIMYTVSPVIP